jgi:hypothetical protein
VGEADAADENLLAVHAQDFASACIRLFTDSRTSKYVFRGS